MLRQAIITGGAGFIGSHLVDRLLDEGGWKVTVIDNFDPLYPRAMKEANIKRHRTNPAFTLVEGDILDDRTLVKAFQQEAAEPAVVVHLAASVGVRPSIADPERYRQVNVEGTANVLEQARKHGVQHFILASSSSVYGEHPDRPWSEAFIDLQPISPYAVTKLQAEKLTREHVDRTGTAATILRFFTVYGPRQRPDLAINTFFRNIVRGLPITQYGNGSTCRDYTFVSDIINGVRAAMDRPLSSAAGQGALEIFNLGNSVTVSLLELIAAIEKESGCKAVVERLPDQPGDVSSTCASVAKAKEHLGFMPRTRLAEGLRIFHQWYEAQVKLPN